MARSLARLVSVVVLMLGIPLVIGPPAWAHGEGETTEGYLLVQQALGHLAHDTSSSGINLAMEKVNDALETDDQEGVDVAELEQGMAALEAGDVTRARRLLQDSIREALTTRPPATGNETGTGQVKSELSGRSDLEAQDWGLLSASILVLLLGAYLAYLFRPHDTVRALRARLATAAAAGEKSPGKGS